jgi:hypothetical protein
MNLIGPYGGLRNDEVNSFKIGLTGNGKEITVAFGHYYFDGILCINDKLDPYNKPVAINYRDQEAYIPEESDLLPLSGGIHPIKNGDNLIYLDSLGAQHKATFRRNRS